MPNITFTSACFTGPQESLEKLRALLSLQGDRQVSDILIPIPVFPTNGKSWYADVDQMSQVKAQYLINQQIYGYDSDYDFVNDVWGSKWGICDIDVNEGSEVGFLSVSWQSAWSPAYGLFYIIARIFPDLLCEFSNEDECANYDPHEIVLKNPQPILDFLLNKRTEHKDILGNDVFSLLDTKSRSCAFMIPTIEKHEITDDKGVTTIKLRSEMTAEDWECDTENASENGEPEATEMHMAINYLKAEMYMNGFNSAYDMLADDALRVIQTRNCYPQPNKKTE